MPDPRIHPIERATDGYGSVTDVSAIIVAANDQRADLMIVNDSEVLVYLARGNAAVARSGIRLNGNGGAFNMNQTDLFLGAIYAVCDEGQDANVTISEGEWQ